MCVCGWLYKRNAFTWQSNFFKLHYSLSRSLSSGSPLWWAGDRKEGCTTFIVLSTQFCINYEELLLRSNQIIVYVLFACDKRGIISRGDGIRAVFNDDIAMSRESTHLQCTDYTLYNILARWLSLGYEASWTLNTDTYLPSCQNYVES